MNSLVAGNVNGASCHESREEGISPETDSRSAHWIFNVWLPGGLQKLPVYLREIPVSKHGGKVSRLLLNVLFVKFPVGQVLSPLLQSR